MLSKPKAESSGGSSEARLDLEVEQIANRVRVFGAIEPADQRPARIRVARRGAIELGLEPRGKRVVGGLVRPRRARRRHRARAELADDALPHIAVVGDTGEIHPVQRQVGGFRALVVTGQHVCLTTAVFAVAAGLGPGPAWGSGAA